MARRPTTKGPVRDRASAGTIPPMTEPSLAVPPRVIEPEHEVYNASLVKRIDETESLAYFWVRFDGEPTPFEPGQYMTIGVMVDGKIVQRPYSVASPPVEAGSEGYEFYVRLVQGGTFTPLLWEMPVGQKMRMIGPKGKFMLTPGDDRTHVFISSGTGNAPFVSMMKQALADGAPRRAVFLNGVSYAHEIGYRSLVEGWAQTVVVRKYMELLRSKTHVLICSGNHDLDSRDGAGEKVAKWVSECRHARVSSDGDTFEIEDTLISVCAWWDGPLMRERVAAQLAMDAKRRKGLTHGLVVCDHGNSNKRDRIFLVLLPVQGADVRVGARGGELHNRPGFNEPRVVIDRDSGNLKVLQRPRRLNAVVRVGWNLFLAQQIVLGSRLRGARRARCGKRTRFVGDPLRGTGPVAAAFGG